MYISIKVLLSIIAIAIFGATGIVEMINNHKKAGYILIALEYVAMIIYLICMHC